MGSNCVYIPIKFKKDENIDDSLLDIVTIFNDKNIDISSVSVSYGDLYNNPEKINSLSNELMNKYITNIDKFSLDESKTFIININNCINGYKDIVSNINSDSELLKKNSNSIFFIMCII